MRIELSGIDFKRLASTNAKFVVSVYLKDLSITGFDDIEHAAIVVPPLTTVYVPTEKIGILAAQCIVELIEGRSIPVVAPLETTVVMLKSLLSIHQKPKL